jgi:hypothetical protein
MTYIPQFVTQPAGINSELSKISVAISRCLQRHSASPNQMETDLDMNSQRVLNLPAAKEPTDPVRLLDMTEYLNGTYKEQLVQDVLQAGGVSLDSKQDTLVSGQNIKTINNQSLLGSGNITISGEGGGGTDDHSILVNRELPDQHPISAITSLQTTLDQKAPTVHSHSIDNVTGLQTTLDQKASTVHSHAIADVTGLQTALDQKAGVSHTQAISTITGLQTALDSKQNTLVSGANIKTVNGNSLLGSGDIVVGAGGGETNTASNLGAGTGVYATKVGADLRFKSLVPGANVTITSDANTVTIASSASGGTSDHSALTNRNIADQHTVAAITGLQAALDGKAGTALATASVDGLMSATDKTKLNGVAVNATANSTDAQLRDRATHTGAQAISTVTGLQTALDAKAGTAVATTTVNGLMSAADKTKLNGVATGATVNATDSQLRDRTTHTGTQAISTVTGLQVALDGKQAIDADLTAIAAVSSTGVLARTGANTWATLADVKEIVVSTTAPTDTTKLWLDIN